MKPGRMIVAGMLTFCVAGLSALPANAADSIERASAASLDASLAGAAAASWVAYQGSEFTVKAIEASGESVVLVLQSAGGAVETSVRVAGASARAASVGVGTSVAVIAESTGYALLASGVVLAFVPNEIGRALLHHARY